MLRAVKFNGLRHLCQHKVVSSQLKPRQAALRNFSAFEKFPPSIGLYDKANERDSCGVGLVTNIKKRTSRKIVEDANEMLVRMSHRGGCGCEVNAGDGAGMLVGMPHEFYSSKIKESFGIDLGEQNSYGAGIVFMQQTDAAFKTIQESFSEQADRLGLEIICWRKIETDNSPIGTTAKATEPQMQQVFVRNTKNLHFKEFDIELYRLRRLVEADVARHDTRKVATDDEDYYICSLSSQTVTYKGQLTPEQVKAYFLDLQQPDFVSHLALVHSRFSTNTFPSWSRAQPNRMLCHNGEINTLRGNKNWFFSRMSLMTSPMLGEGHDDQEILHAPMGEMSDSGHFDRVLELLTKGSPRTLPECVTMMIPEAWQDNQSLSEAKRKYYEYNSCLMEPWDGPAMIAFTDGRYIGANLDRNGLRPSRYYVTKDDTVMLSSEVGVVPELPEKDIKVKARLEPGKMFLVDFEAGEIVSDHVIKEEIAQHHDYAQWLKDNLFTMSEWVEGHKQTEKNPFKFYNTDRYLTMFGYTVETEDMLLYPMAVGGKEALGSMGNDAALAVLSDQPRMMSDFFKQLFAQVTNPPIDPIREEMVMSLQCPVGPEDNLLSVTPEHCARLLVKQPILSLEEMDAVKSVACRDWTTSVIDCTLPVDSTTDDLIGALDDICTQAAQAVQGSYGKSGAQIVILSDVLAGPDDIPIPSLLTVGAVHQHLIRTKLRSKAALFVESGDAREVHDFATLLGFGADAICPHIAYEAIARMNYNGSITARSHQQLEDEELFYNYRLAAHKGILKVMSKMGISTLQSYKGAQVFEALGLRDEVMERCFTGTPSRIQGAGFNDIFEGMRALHAEAFPVTDEMPALPNPGQFHYRNGGEAHLNTPLGMVALQEATNLNSAEKYREYAAHVNEMNKACTLRGSFKFKDNKDAAIPISEVESASEIVKRFNTGAMSLGSISQEAHETLAMAMNSIGARSNTGEGGEDPKRFSDNRRSAIKQVASGRFGVTSHYLANSDQIQIKMAQGAKPGEGGELPGSKVTPYIAQNRHTTPGVGLISPPPHHDIYSIEDLAQLIHDLKNAQPHGEVSVKLVSEVGVGVVAAGVAKAKADHITISGGDGGTGAAVWTGVKGAGLPWELGIADAQQTLVLNDLRSRVRLQTDGQIKTGRDVVIAAMLGAEEFGFSTAPLIALGCIMMRKCHLNTCPVGIATQDPLLRKKFKGQPEHVVNFFFLMAEEIREYMAMLGIRTMEELVGRVDLLEPDQEVLKGKNADLDLSALLQQPTKLNPDAGVVKSMQQDHLLHEALDNEIIQQAKPALEEGVPVTIELPVTNLDRTVGTMLSYEISKKFGSAGLPDDTIKIKLTGHGGQSMGFALAKGVSIEIEGDSNDYVGKGLSGGSISVYPHRDILADGEFKAHEHVIVGNTCLYGASSGSAFFRGKAGERFCVRNSGALAVVEAVGDHGCEYMTGGRVVVLGETGRNFAAGMSGGVAYIYDPAGKFPDRCNRGMVGLENVEEEIEVQQLKEYITRHQQATASPVAEELLAQWPAPVKDFVKVMPTDYKRVLQQEAAAAVAAAIANAGEAEEAQNAM